MPCVLCDQPGPEMCERCVQRSHADPVSVNAILRELYPQTEIHSLAYGGRLGLQVAQQDAYEWRLSGSVNLYAQSPGMTGRINLGDEPKPAPPPGPYVADAWAWISEDAAE